MTNKRFGWHSGALTCRNITVENDMTIMGNLTFGDASVDSFVIKGRMSSMTAAGANIECGSAYTYGEGMELRWARTVWSTGTSFNGAYFRAENQVASASTRGVTGIVSYGVNNTSATSTLNNIFGLYAEALLKGGYSITLTEAYGIEGDLCIDARGANTVTISTQASAMRASLGFDSGISTANLAKMHGLIIDSRDGRGGSTASTIGHAIYVLNRGEGVQTWTTGLNLNAACGIGIDFGGLITYRAIRIGTKTSAATSLQISSGLAVDAEPANNYLLGLFGKVSASEATSTDELRGAWIRTRVNDGCHVGTVPGWGYGVCGAEIQLKVYADSAATNMSSWQNSAVWAQLETQGASGVNFKSGSYSQCVLANVGLTATTTIDALANVAGVTINSNTAAAVTATGGFYGLFITQKTAGLLDFQSGIYINSGSCTTGMTIAGVTTTGISMAGGASYNPLHIGVKANTADSGLILTGVTDDTGGVMIFCDDGGDALGSVTSPIWTRYLITTNQGTGGPTATGLYAQTKNLAATFATGSYTALKAYYQVGGATILNGTATELSIINAGINYEGNMTVTVGTLSGIDINVNDGGFTIGTSSGLLIRKTSGSTLGWTTGITIADAGTVTGISIGTATNGINLTGAVTRGVDFATGTLDTTATQGSISALSIGKRGGTALTLTYVNSRACHFDPIQMNIDIAGANPNATSTMNLIYQNVTHTTTAMSNLRIKGADWTVTASKDVKDIYIFQGEVDFTAATTVSGEAAGLAISMTTAVTSAVTGNVWGAILMSSFTSAVSVSSSLFISHRAGTLTNGIYFEPLSGATITNLMLVNNAGTITNFLNATDNGAPFETRASPATTLAAADGRIKVLIGTKTLYIPLFQTVTIA